MPSRRRLLSGLATGVAAAAGCVSSPGGTPTDSPTDVHTTTVTRTPGSPTGTPPPEGVEVSRIVARKAVTYDSSMGSGGVLTDPDTQYVVATVRSREDLAREDFALETDERTWSPGLPDTAGARNYAVAGHEGGEVGDVIGTGTRSFLAFAIPSPVAVSNPRIRYAPDDETWPLPEAARATLPAPAAEFELDEFSVPAEVSQGNELPVSLTVRNTSDTTGRFLAAAYWPTKLVEDDDESHLLIARDVVAGETVTLGRNVDTSYTTDEDETVSLRVDGHVDAERDVRVTDAGTPS